MMMMMMMMFVGVQWAVRCGGGAAQININNAVVLTYVVVVVPRTLCFFVQINNHGAAWSTPL